MEPKFFFLLPIFAGFSACNTPKPITETEAIDELKSERLINPAKTDAIVLGDINKDKIIDTAFVYTPPTRNDPDEDGKPGYTFGCVDDDCFNKVTFSCGLPAIRIENSVWGKVENAGDLDKDGISEILFERGWFIGSSAGLELYQFKRGEWHLASKIVFRPNDDESLKDRLVKKRGKFYLKGYKAFNGDEVEDLQEVFLVK
ncbi:hypothetical protein [Flavobacterium sp.]|uniref:hypothetical protein n=1 Tax=Flavobacterium sp. TaxID=239 RepID=UPI00121E1E08|nr:hypothetical protein [Flavobacterium sp.]RZJ70379.1 MAG: hypothetical protein EOO49_13940 [Flavobacterium sp.]